jgi:NADH-quinone oxidoreductase subunit C
MDTLEIFKTLQQQFPNAVLELDNTSEPAIIIRPENLFEICRFLKEYSELMFDYLIFVSALDNKDNLQVVYALASYKYNHMIILKVNLSAAHPEISSIISLWSGADWHERETYDLFGITFTAHPNLQRIMLPPDWEGHPLRKDYEHPNLIKRPGSF